MIRNESFESSKFTIVKFSIMTIMTKVGKSMF